MARLFIHYVILHLKKIYSSLLVRIVISVTLVYIYIL